MRFFRRSFIFSLSLFAFVPGVFAQSLSDKSPLSESRTQNSSNSEFSGCWDALTEFNTVVFCINYNLVAASYFYPNDEVVGDENICNQRGEIKHISPKTMNLDFDEGDCFGDNIFPAMSMNCELTGQTFSCEVTDADVDDSLMSDLPTFAFEPIGRSLQKK